MIIHGDCLEEMRKMADNSISAIVTDSPYGIAFMSKDWDKGIPSVEYWKEMIRIVKPGGHLIAAGLPRMMHRLISVIEDAGWEVRDLLMHIFGSGFPKSHNHFGIEGYGTALKPAWEGWSLCMKPCYGTFKQNAEKWGQAGINIDACRIGTDDTRSKCSMTALGQNSGWNDHQNKEVIGGSAKGRWPANVIFDEEAAKMLDEQSGVSKAKSQREGIKGGSGFGYFDDDKTSSMKGIWPGDSGGGASRFFYCAKTSSRERNEGLEGLLDKQNSGCYGEFEGDGRGRQTEHAPMKNNHPTVKPLKLMRYLITLIMPPKDGILLDPFAGSGSTIIAAHQLGVKAIGIEKQAEYVEIASKRLEYYKDIKEDRDLDLFDKVI